MSSDEPWERGLIDRAAAQSQQALSDLLAGRQDTFFVGAARAVELLAKARLAMFHPALIIDPNSPDSLLHACGAGAHAKIPAWRVRTLRFSALLERCLLVEPHLKGLDKAIRHLADLRNSIVHMGEPPMADADEVFDGFVRAMAVLLRGCGVDSRPFFGAHADVVGAHLDRSATEVKRKVALLLGKARSMFEEKYGHLSTEERKAIFETVTAPYEVEGYDQALVTCPACGQLAWAGGTTHVEWRGPRKAYPDVTVLPWAFDCWVCGLRLVGVEALDEAGLAMPIVIKEVDPTDFYEDIGEGEGEAPRRVKPRDASPPRPRRQVPK